MAEVDPKGLVYGFLDTLLQPGDVPLDDLATPAVRVSTPLSRTTINGIVSLREFQTGFRQRVPADIQIERDEPVVTATEAHVTWRLHGTSVASLADITTDNPDELHLSSVYRFRGGRIAEVSTVLAPTYTVCPRGKHVWTLPCHCPTGVAS